MAQRLKRRKEMMGLQGWCALGSVRKLGQRERPWDRLRVAMKQPVGSILRCGLGVPERSGGKLACCVLRGGSGGNTTFLLDLRTAGPHAR